MKTAATEAVILPSGSRKALLPPYVTVVCLGVLLVATFSLYSFAYFSVDDFNNLYWMQQAPAGRVILDFLNPFANAFRPAGMLMYWVFWHLFGLNAVPYHLAAWSLHALNTLLIYRILSTLLHSPTAASWGAMLFAFQAIFTDVYWSFGTIFELLAASFFLAAILLYIESERIGVVLSVVGMTVLLMLAFKSKEMAITLPGILLIAEITVKRRRSPVLLLANAVWFLYAVWFAISKTASMGGTSPDQPYYMDLRWVTLGRGYGWYFDRLFAVRMRWGTYAIAGFLTAVICVYLRRRTPLFFLSYVFVTLLPVVFLVNHRWAFYWYIPFLGVAGLAAGLGKSVMAFLRRRFDRSVSLRTQVILGSVAFALACMVHYSIQKNRSIPEREHFQNLSEQYRSFVTGLHSLPPPATNQTVYYTAIPEFLDEVSLLSATQVAFQRTDLKAVLVPAFPEEAIYRVVFDGASVSLAPSPE